jgi:hypothetical protein
MRRLDWAKALLFIAFVAGCEAPEPEGTDECSGLSDISTGGNAAGGAAAAMTGGSYATGGRVFGVGGYIDPSPDSDGDGIDDEDELELGLDPESRDSDGDGCLDDDEIHFDGCTGEELVTNSGCGIPQLTFSVPDDIPRPTGNLWLMIVPQDSGASGEGGQGTVLPNERIPLTPLNTAPPFDGSLGADSFSVDAGSATIVFEVPDSDHFEVHDYLLYASSGVVLVDENDTVLASWRLLVKNTHCIIL